MKDNSIKKFEGRSFFSRVLPLFVLAHFAHHLVTSLPAPLLPFIRDEFALNYTQSGLVLMAFSLAYGFGNLPAGWLADRVGYRIGITIGICGAALAGLLVGLSHTFLIMIVFMVLMGVLGGGYHPAAPPLISASVEPKKQGRALGLHMIGGSGGCFVTPIIAAAIAAAWGWRGSFIGLAIPTAVFGVIFYVLLGWWAGTGKVQQVACRHGKTPFPPGNVRRLVAFMVLSASTLALSFSIISFIPLFMVDYFGVSESAAAAFLAIFYSAGLWASPLGGYLSDRLGAVPLTLVACLICGPLIYLLGMVPYGLASGALLLAIGVFIYGRTPVAEAYIISHAPEHRRSTILGLYYFVGMEAGGAITPVIGWLIDQFGFQACFTIISVALVVMTLVCAPFLWGRGK